MKPILTMEKVTKIYGNLPNQTMALNGIDFQVMPGEFLGIMGSSGSGKSTLLNCIATVIQPTSGVIQIEGRPLQNLKRKDLATYRGKSVGYLFQNFELLDKRNRMEKLSDLNKKEKTTILMVTHDSNAASFCKRILFIQDGLIVHELRCEEETRQSFYERILKVMAQLGGGSSYVL